MASKPATAQLRVGAKSHTGLVRTENQDRMGRFPSPFGELFIVADGMGGHQGGALAAAMTTDGFEKYLRVPLPNLTPHDALQQAAQQINAEIYRAANSGDPSTAKMGSTVVLALVNGSQALIGHAGDSRAYLVRQSRLTRLTKDHSAVQKMIDHNMLTEAEARDHPDASIINRAFGQTPELELEISAPLTIAQGDGLLLCSDGLCGYVDDPVIESAVGRYEDAQKIADTLIELALNAGGEDNVTIQYLQFGARAAVGGRPLEAQTSSPHPVSVASASVSGSKAGSDAGLFSRMKYAVVAAVLVAIFALGYLAGKIPKWLNPPAPATPSPSVAPVQPRQTPASSGEIQPFQLPSPTPNSSVIQENSPVPTPYPTPTLNSSPAPASASPKPDPPGTVTDAQAAKDLIKKEAKELGNKVKDAARPLDQKTNEPPKDSPAGQPGNAAGAPQSNPGNASDKPENQTPPAKGATPTPTTKPAGKRPLPKGTVSVSAKKNAKGKSAHEKN